ncbi:MAG: BolA family transcriptional regulator [Gammaproteobacteria bacterium]|nr:MAG: BolA family transcriptional regulator [Gammaproteobacteria bacterium]
MSDRVKRIRRLLEARLAPVRLEIQDDSARHAGHAGARGGGGHFIVHIVSPEFANLSLVERHRLVYDALAEMMPGEIHALSIDARAPDET